MRWIWIMKRVLIVFFFALLLFPSVPAGYVHAVVSQPGITGTVGSVQGYIIFIEGSEQGFYVGAISNLQGVSPSNLGTLVGKSVTITYRTVSGKNRVLSLVLNNNPS